MNSPLKMFMHKYLEFRIFKHFLSSYDVDLTGKAILEVGCGSGYGLELISRRFRPSRLIGFDILPEQVNFARKRGIPGVTKLFVGSVENIKLSPASFDSVFIFTVFHHVEGWREGLREVNKVLKPKGILLVNELNKRSLERFERYLKVSHPKRSRFSWEEFREGLASAGFKILRERMILRDFGFFMCMKARSFLTSV